MSFPDARQPIGRRTFLAGAGGAALLGAAAACGGNTGRGGGGGTAISQWYHQYGETGTEQAAKRCAASYKKATVAVQWTPGDYASKLNAGLLSSKGPDVFESQFNVQLARAGRVAPLDDIIDPVKSDDNSYDITANTYKGHIYGVRMIDDPQFFYYRKSMFDRAGLKHRQGVDHEEGQGHLRRQRRRRRSAGWARPVVRRTQERSSRRWRSSISSPAGTRSSGRW